MLLFEGLFLLAKLDINISVIKTKAKIADLTVCSITLFEKNIHKIKTNKKKYILIFVLDLFKSEPHIKK